MLNLLTKQTSLEWIRKNIIQHHHLLFLLDPSDSLWVLFHKFLTVNSNSYWNFFCRNSLKLWWKIYSTKEICLGSSQCLEALLIGTALNRLYLSLLGHKISMDLSYTSEWDVLFGYEYEYSREVFLFVCFPKLCTMSWQRISLLFHAMAWFYLWYTHTQGKIF